MIDELKQEKQDYPVWPENWATVEMFMRLQTQWRVGYDGRYGLDYNAVSVVFNLLGTENQREIFDGLQVMEFSAMRVIRSKED